MCSALKYAPPLKRNESGGSTPLFGGPGSGPKGQDLEIQRKTWKSWEKLIKSEVTSTQTPKSYLNKELFLFSFFSCKFIYLVTAQVTDIREYADHRSGAGKR
jgi:hypothetical protein